MKFKKLTVSYVDNLADFYLITLSPPYPITLQMIFKESDLTFNFAQEDWEIIRYDTHRYYKILSGAGLKGVDFLGIYQENKVVFFEVKHFRSPPLTKTISYSIFEDTPAFTQRITRKLQDTLKATKVIIQYLNRKWWYRFLIQYSHLIPNFLIKNRDWYFWYRLHLMAQQKEVVTYVLWLEIQEGKMDYSTENLIPSLTKALENNLSAIVGKVIIANRKKLIFEESLTIG